MRQKTNKLVDLNLAISIIPSNVNVQTPKMQIERFNKRARPSYPVYKKHCINMKPQTS